MGVPRATGGIPPMSERFAAPALPRPDAGSISPSVSFRSRTILSTIPPCDLRLPTVLLPD